jgi:hypothetical protein
VPSVCHLDDWFPRLGHWLRRHGLGHVTFGNSGFFANDPTWRSLYREHYLIAGGPAARGHQHSVVYRGVDELVHDPHPSRAGLIEVEDFTFITVADPKLALWLLAPRH